jgi:hypothetical protein
MLARLRRPALSFVAAATVAGLLAAPSLAQAATVPTRARQDAGPAPRFVFGTGAAPSRRSVPEIPVRRSTARGDEVAPRTGRTTAPTPPLAPVAAAHFDAIAQQGVNYPADPTGAIGQTNIVTAVNTSVAVYARDGTELLAPTALADLIQPLVEGQQFDPKIVYDQYAQRFVLVWLVRNGRLRRSWINIMTIPDATAGDLSTWCGVKLHGDGVRRNGRQWADYPGLGYDADSVTITTNAFNFARRHGFAYAQIFHIANSQLFPASGACTAPVAYRVFAAESTRNVDGSKAFTIQPAQTEGASNGDQYLVAYDESGSLTVWRLRETVEGLVLKRVGLPVRATKIAPFGTQKGGTLLDDDTWWDPGDLRLVNAFYDADLGRLYTAHAIARDLRPDPVTGGYLESVIRWYEVDPAHRLKASRLGRVGLVGAPETDAGWPAVATDASGNLFVTYSRASQPLGEYPSAWAAEIHPGATRAELTLLTAGTARIEALPGVERWGDFNAINRDPVDGTFVAMVNQYAKADGAGRRTRDWQQTFDLVSDG